MLCAFHLNQMRARIAESMMTIDGIPIPRPIFARTEKPPGREDEVDDGSPVMYVVVLTLVLLVVIEKGLDGSPPVTVEMLDREETCVCEISIEILDTSVIMPTDVRGAVALENVDDTFPADS